MATYRKLLKNRAGDTIIPVVEGLIPCVKNTILQSISTKTSSYSFTANYTGFLIGQWWATTAGSDAQAQVLIDGVVVVGTGHMIPYNGTFYNNFCIPVGKGQTVSFTIAGAAAILANIYDVQWL